jgi:hypothetical protein
MHLRLHNSRDNKRELAWAPAPAAGNDDAPTVMCQPTPSFSIGRRAVESDVADTEHESPPESSSSLILYRYLHCINHITVTNNTFP